MIVIVESLLTGKVRAGARGWHTNFYYRATQPLLYYGFVFIYGFIAYLIFSKV